MTPWLHSDVDISSHLPGNATSESAQFWIVCVGFLNRREALWKTPFWSRMTELPCCCMERTTGRCTRLLWKRSRFPCPKCIWKPLLVRMLFYSVSKCFATLRESTNWHRFDTIQKLELFSCHTSPCTVCSWVTAAKWSRLDKVIVYVFHIWFRTVYPTVISHSTMVMGYVYSRF